VMAHPAWRQLHVPINDNYTSRSGLGLTVASNRCALSVYTTSFELAVLADQTLLPLIAIR